jgi:cytoskeletal protein RodZ
MQYGMPGIQPFYPNLSALRRQRGISLESITTATQIGKRYLEAIERGEFSVLPGGIYDISYIRQYARAVDYDEEDLLGCYFARTGRPEPAGSAEGTRTLWNVNIFKLRKA